MELFQLRAFLAVAEELHFGQAAKRLGIAQPPLSRTIRQLEEDLGTELFFRTTRTVTLSPAGSALLGPARSILDTCRTAEDSIRRASDGDIGRVRFGFAGASSNRLVALITGATRRQKPGISFELESTTFAEEALSRLIDGTLDLALARWTQKPAHISGRLVMTEEPVVSLYADHPLAERKSLTISDVADEDLVMFPNQPRSSLRDTIVGWFHEQGHTPRIVQEAPDSWLIGALVGGGVGITITYDSVARAVNVPGVVTVPLHVDHEPVQVYIAHHAENTNPALQEVLAAAEEVLPTVSRR